MDELIQMRLVEAACVTHPEWGPWACVGDEHIEACARRSKWAHPKDDHIAFLEKENARLRAAGDEMAKAMDDKLEALEAAGDALAMRCGGWAWPELVAWRKARDKEELSLAEEMLKDAHPGVDD